MQPMAQSSSLAFHPLSQHPQVVNHSPSLIDTQASQYSFYPPQFMDSAGSASSVDPGPSSSSPTMPTGPSNSITSAGIVKKKPGRGPGRKENKDRPTVSVRWEDGDLTERLIRALEMNERWAGVFVQASPEQGQPRVSIGVPKRDLQREIAKHLFQGDARYDVDDKKTLEALAVSIKNKLFKITTLYNECKAELGYAGNYKDEREIAPGSEYAATWTRVKEKFPQFYRIRDMISRLGPGTPRQDESTTTINGEPTSANRSRPTTANAGMNVPLPTSSSSSLRGAVDMPVTYMDPSLQASSTSGMSSGYMQSQATVGPSMTGPATSPTYSMHSPQMQTQAGTNYSQAQVIPQTSSQVHSRRPAQALHVNVPGATSSSRPQGMVGLSSAHVVHAPQPMSYASSPLTQSTQPAPSPYSRSQLQTSTLPSSTTNTHPETLSPSPTPGPPSPPLSTTIQSIITTLTTRKEKERSRQHDREMMRLKREEAERQRWHEREMMRLRIQLIRAERANANASAAGDGMSLSSAGRSGGGMSFPSRRESMASHSHFSTGATEEELAAAMAAEDMSVEGDGEGEADDEMHMDPEPPRSGHAINRSMQLPNGMRGPPGAHHQ